MFTEHFCKLLKANVIRKVMGAPYTRRYHHSKNTGKEGKVKCNYCGRLVPRWKTFSSFKGFRVSDPVIRQSIDRRYVSAYNKKIYVCPACARYRRIVQVGRSRKSRAIGKGVKRRG
jgi:small subunit ribosomal protein S26e